MSGQPLVAPAAPLPARRGLETPGMTDPDPVLAHQVRNTVPGMAHLGGTGPAGTTCRQCDHWGKAERHKRTADGLLENRECQAFIRLMNGEHGAGVPHHMLSCRHYTPRASPAPITRPLPKPRGRKSKNAGAS